MRAPVGREVFADALCKIHGNVHESLRQFHPVIGRWFEEKVGYADAAAGDDGWPVIGAGKSIV